MVKAVRLALLAVLVAVAIGCGSPVSPGPATAPPGASSSTPSSPAVAPTPSPAAASDAAEAIDVLVASMATAVETRDRAGYVARIDLSDPAFALEHTRWADDWSGAHPVRTYALRLADLEISESIAIGQLTVTWQLAGDEGPRTATFAVRFTHGGDGWRYAGENWVTTEAPHLRIRVAPGLEGSAPAIAAEFPAIYDHVTTSVGYEPLAPLELKLYVDAPALVANTLLSLPNIRGWNEPGEALKLQLGADAPPLAPVIAHEMTHFVVFDRAGTHRSRMPWWLDEGLASFVAETFEGSWAPDRLGQVIEWEAAGELASWDAMAVFEEAQLDLWRFVYPQGYAMVRYVTEEYGASARNAWLATMATEMDIDGATPAKLGVTFDQLDASFRSWLRSQRPIP